MIWSKQSTPYCCTNSSASNIQYLWLGCSKFLLVEIKIEVAYRFLSLDIQKLLIFISVFWETKSNYRNEMQKLTFQLPEWFKSFLLFWKHRNSRSHMHYKISVSKNFTKYTKYLCRGLCFSKVAGLSLTKACTLTLSFIRNFLFTQTK